MTHINYRIGENVILWVEMAWQVGFSIILLLGSMILHWRFSDENTGSKMAKSLPIFGGAERKNGGGFMTDAFNRWQGTGRRVLRGIAQLIFWVNITISITVVTIALTLFQFIRDDGVVARPQRFLGYTIAYTLMSMALASYYHISKQMTNTWLIPASVFTMLFGWAIAYLPYFQPANVFFSIMAMLILAFVPITMFAGSPFNLLESYWRLIPLLLHYFSGIALWIVLWLGPLANSSVGDIPWINLINTLGYVIVEVIWIVGLVFSIYIIDLGDERITTSATDAIISSVRYNKDGNLEKDNESRHMASFNPSSPAFQNTPRGSPSLLSSTVQNKGPWASTINNTNNNNRGYNSLSSAAAPVRTWPTSARGRVE